MMRFVALTLLLAVPLSAQLRESIEVRVLELEATVLDRAGHPVEGLKQEDFRVQVGKKDVPITNFFAVRNGVVLAEEKSAPASTTPVAAETSIPTSIVIFVDELHLTPASRKRAFDALKRYVGANLSGNTTAMIIRYFKHFDVRLRPTERAGYILAELDKLESNPVANDSGREREQMIGMIDGIFGVNGHSAADTAGESPDTIFYRLIEYAERRQSEVVKLLGEDGIRRVRVDVKLLRQLASLLLIPEDVSGSLTSSFSKLSRLLTCRRFFWLCCSLLESLAREPNAAKEAPNSRR